MDIHGDYTRLFLSIWPAKSVENIRLIDGGVRVKATAWNWDEAHLIIEGNKVWMTVQYHWLGSVFTSRHWKLTTDPAHMLVQLKAMLADCSNPINGGPLLRPIGMGSPPDQEMLEAHAAAYPDQMGCGQWLVRVDDLLYLKGMGKDSILGQYSDTAEWCAITLEGDKVPVHGPRRI